MGTRRRAMNRQRRASYRGARSPPARYLVQAKSVVNRRPSMGRGDAGGGIKGNTGEEIRANRWTGAGVWVDANGAALLGRTRPRPHPPAL